MFKKFFSRYVKIKPKRNKPSAKKLNGRLHHLKKAQYQEGAFITLTNAESLFDLAEIAASKKYYGHAFALLILSAEELSKAFILRAKALSTDIKVHKIEFFFHNHEIKHNLLIELISKLLTLELDQAFKEELKVNDNTTINKGVIVLLATIVALVSNKDPIRKNKDMRVEDFRQNGLYVSFIEKEDKWIAPNLVYTEQTWVSSSTLYKSVFDFFRSKVFNENYSELELLEFLDKIKFTEITRRRFFRS